VIETETAFVSWEVIAIENEMESQNVMKTACESLAPNEKPSLCE
jgi:hypothetical protein